MPPKRAAKAPVTPAKRGASPAEGDTDFSDVETLKIGRAPVLSLWGAVVCERQGFSRSSALTLGRWVSATGAQKKARALGFAEKESKKEKEAAVARDAAAGVGNVNAFHTSIPVIYVGGEPRAAEKGAPMDPTKVQKYLENAFGGPHNLAAAEAAMAELAAAVPVAQLPDECVHLYEKFRPDAGFGAKGDLDLLKIKDMAAERRGDARPAKRPAAGAAATAEESAEEEEEPEEPIDWNPDVIHINRAPVLALWAAVVCMRQCYTRREAVTMGRWLAGVMAQTKGQSIGKFEKKEHSDEEMEERAERDAAAGVRKVEAFSTRVPVIEVNGELRAAKEGKPTDPDKALTYFEKSFGDKQTLAAAETAMEELASAVPLQELRKQCFHMYEEFRPEWKGWGEKGSLDLGTIKAMAAERRESGGGDSE